MGDLLMVRIWRHQWPALSALATMAVVFLWPAIPLGSLWNWLQFFYYYTPQNYLYALLTLLSGVYVGIYVYNKKVRAVCRVGAKKSGAAGMVGGVLLGACPACIPALGFFLPLSVTIYLSRISWMFLVAAIILMIFLVVRMDAFKKIDA